MVKKSDRARVANKPRGSRSGFTKAKRKGVLIGGRLKPNSNILKPNSTLSGQKSNPFGDRSNMGPMVSEKDLDSFQFQSIRYVLNSNKNVAIKIVNKPGSSI